MADNIIQVNVTSSKPKRVSVSSSNVQNEITASSDTSKYYSGLARSWATSETLVENTDYSAKYYANKSKVNAENSKINAENTQTLYNDFIDNFSNYQGLLEETAQSGVTAINETSTQATESINNTVENAIETIDNSVVGVIADINKEFEEEKQEIEDLANLIKDNAQEIANRTSFAMFDTVLKDHILTFEESKGLALQGTYVYKEAVAGSRYGYPDFYNKCLEEKDLGVATETTLGDNTITMYINANGHQFYDIADKDIIDAWFNTYGMAWFYGVDTENERIYLPRNNWFEQLTADGSEVGKSVEAGLPNIKGTFGCRGMEDRNITQTGALYKAGTTGAKAAGDSSGSLLMGFDASRSNAIYSKSDTVQPNAVKKLLYICVGNTESKSTVTDVVEVTTTENDTLPLLHHIPADELLEHPSWLRSAGQWNSGNVYTTVYEYLVAQYVNGTEHTDTLKGSDGTEYTVTYKTVKGKKVVDVANVGQVDAVYSAIGSAWYYVINQDDMTFRLPMSHNTECYTSDPTRLGLDVSAGLPNITGSFQGTRSSGQDNYIAPTGAFIKGASFDSYQAGGTDMYNTGFDASLSNPIYGNSDTVTPPHTEFYLYFKVANAVQNLELLDAGKVLEAVNSVIPNNKDLLSGLGMPSGKYIDLTLGASGTSYTAPANGYFAVRIGGNNSFVDMQYSDISETGVQTTANANRYSASCFLPVGQGRGIVVNYIGNVLNFRFIYAVGSESEA